MSKLAAVKPSVAAVPRRTGVVRPPPPAAQLAAKTGGRRPFGQSTQQNQQQQADTRTTTRNVNKPEDLRLQPEAPKPSNTRAVTRSTGSVANDENAEVALASRSRIPTRTESKKNTRGFVVTDMKPREELAFSSNLIPDGVEDIDANDADNVFLTPDYVKEIYCYLRKLENDQAINSNFLAIQPQMTPRMRSVLVDWLINVHYQFKLLPETLYLGISIMDRFFQKEIISKDKIQLVGVTAFFIASKFEEIYPPDIKDFVMICDKLYHKRDIIKMELAILRSLKFELGRPLPLHFLRRNSKAAHADSRIHCLAKYLMELTLVEYECAHWPPSYLAAVSLFVTLRVLADSRQMALKWTPTLEYYSNYREEELLSGAALLCKVIQKSDKSKFQNCRKKYSSAKLMEISSIPQLKSDCIDQMAATAN